MVMLRKYKGKNQNPDGLPVNNRPSIFVEESGRKKQKPLNIDPEKEWQRVKAVWDSVEAWERYSGLKLPEDHEDREVA